MQTHTRSQAPKPWGMFARLQGVIGFLAVVIAFAASNVLAAPRADVYFLGEVHDNPAHHQVQADWVQRIGPKAVVFEMIPPDLANGITPELRASPDVLADYLDWNNSGWPDFAMYWPIFTAAPDARIYGAALPRDQARAAFGRPLIDIFGADVAIYGLDQPLPADEQKSREALQFNAHCGKLPETLLPQMVKVQRLRDAFLARAAVTALDETGGPVVVITGNGHARQDWGAPVALHQARPGLAIFTLGQSEDGRIEGQFDQVIDAPAAPRPDPCAAFQSAN